MRLPRSWNDADLNKDEPFVTAFLARTEHLRDPISRRHIQPEAEWFHELAEEVARADTLGACQAWLDIVFAVVPTEKDLLRKQRFFASNPREGRFFVEFFWRLYSTGACNARRVITEGRQARGFRWDMRERPTGATSGGAGGEQEADGTQTQGRPCEARGDVADNAAHDAPTRSSSHDTTPVGPVLASLVCHSEDEKEEDILSPGHTDAVFTPQDSPELPSAVQRKSRASRTSLLRTDESEQEGEPPVAALLSTTDAASASSSFKQRRLKGQRRKMATSRDAKVNQDIIIIARRTRSKQSTNASREVVGSVSAPTQLAARPGNQTRLTRASAKRVSLGGGLNVDRALDAVSASAAEPPVSVQLKKKHLHVRRQVGRNEDTTTNVSAVSPTMSTSQPMPIERIPPADRKKRQRKSRARTPGPTPSAPTSDSAADDPASTGTEDVDAKGGAKRQKILPAEIPVPAASISILEPSTDDSVPADEVPAEPTREAQEEQGIEPPSAQEHVTTFAVDLAGAQGNTSALNQSEQTSVEGPEACLDVSEKDVPQAGQGHYASPIGDLTGAQGVTSTLQVNRTSGKVMKKPRVSMGEKPPRKKRSDAGVKREPHGPKRVRTEIGPATCFEQHVQKMDMPGAVGNAMHAIPGSNMSGDLQYTFIEDPAPMDEATPMLPGCGLSADGLPPGEPRQIANSQLLLARPRKRECPIQPEGGFSVQDGSTTSNGPSLHDRPKKKLPRRPPAVPILPVGYGSWSMTPLQAIDAALSNIGAGGLEYHNHVPALVDAWDHDELDIIGDPEDHHRHDEEQIEQNPPKIAGPSAQPELAVKVTKPSLPRRPPIWASSRQEVCESLDCFRSYQGGVYFNNDVAKGYLLSAFAASRDMFEHGGRLIVSHGGGKAQALHAKSGQLEMRTAANQLAGDKSVRALLNNYKAGRPVVLLADDRYALFPFDLEERGFTYVILGMYRIVHAWAEYQLSGSDAGRVIRYKFAFEWCAEQGTPWWCQTGSGLLPPSGDGDHTAVVEDGVPPMPLPESSDLDLPFGPTPEPRTHQQCTVCNAESPKVYEQGWMCLQPGCSSFGLSQTGTDLFAGQLNYNPDFLTLQHQSAERNPAYDVHVPELPPTGDDVTTHRFSRGMHCKNCGRLSCRSKWEGWQCSSCQAFVQVNGKLRCHKDFWTQDTKAKKWLHAHVKPGSGIVAGPTTGLLMRNGSMPKTHQTFILPNGRGKIHHIVADVLSNQEANKIFQEYQEQAQDGRLEFRRWPLRVHKCRGELLTNYFSQNTGAPYQYVGGTDRTVPLESGPSAVIGALNLITNRVKEILGLDVPFNEVLSAAYMQKQKMAFHSDAERGLGGVVAGLSLGSMAQMEFRLHSQQAKTTDGRMNRGTVLTITLRHGDILVMDGHDVQNYYEHTVTPMNFRIAATARFISPENWRT